MTLFPDGYKRNCTVLGRVTNLATIKVPNLINLILTPVKLSSACFDCALDTGPMFGSIPEIRESQNGSHTNFAYQHNLQLESTRSANWIRDNFSETLFFINPPNNNNLTALAPKGTNSCHVMWGCCAITEIYLTHLRMRKHDLRIIMKQQLWMEI